MRANTVASIPELLQIINEFSCLDIRIKKSGDFFKNIYFSNSICGTNQRKRLYSEKDWRHVVYKEYMYCGKAFTIDKLPWMIAETKREYLFEYYSVPFGSIVINNIDHIRAMTL